MLRGSKRTTAEDAPTNNRSGSRHWIKTHKQPDWQLPQSQARPLSHGNLGYSHQANVSQADSSSFSSTASLSEVEFRLSEALRANAAFEDSYKALQDENVQLRENLMASERYCKRMENQMGSVTSERNLLATKLKNNSTVSLSQRDRQLENNLSFLMSQVDRLKTTVQDRDDLKLDDLCTLVNSIELLPGNNADSSSLSLSQQQQQQHGTSATHDPHAVQIKTLNNEIQRLKHKVEKTEKEFLEYKEKSPPAEAYQRVIDQLRSSLLSYSTEQHSGMATPDSVSPQKYQKLKDRSRADSEKLRGLSNKYNQLTKRKSELKMEVQRLQDELRECKPLKERNRDLHEELNSLRLNYNSQSARVGELERKIKYLSQVKGFNKENVNSQCSSGSYHPRYSYGSSSDMKKPTTVAPSSEYSLYSENRTPAAYSTDSARDRPSSVNNNDNDANITNS